MKKTILFGLVILNIYFISHLFCGNNNVMNFIKYKKQNKQLEMEKHSIMKQRYKLEQLSFLLSNTNKDSDDVLDELLRQLVQLSLPEEKIVLIEQEK